MRAGAALPISPLPRCCKFECFSSSLTRARARVCEAPGVPLSFRYRLLAIWPPYLAKCVYSALMTHTEAPTVADLSSLETTYRDAPYGHAIITRSIIAGQPRDVSHVVIVAIDGDTLTYTTDGVWYSTVRRSQQASWRVAYTARRIAERFYEYVNEDDTGPGDQFNVDAAPHTIDDQTWVADSVAELVAWVRQDGVTFAATGNTWASDPDGSQIIDYATGERECISWHFDSVSPALLDRVIIPAVDAR